MRRIKKILRRAKNKARVILAPEVQHIGGKSGDGKSFGIITLAHNTDLYNQMDDIKRVQFAELPHLFVYNEPTDRPKNITDVIYLSAAEHPSGIPMMFRKFIYCLRNHIDSPAWDACSYIIRSNSSTFINLPILREYLSHLPATRCYAGSIMNNAMISGTCIVFSRDVVDIIIKYSKKFDFHEYDDVVISEIMKYSGIPMIDLPMKYFINNTIPTTNETEECLRQYPIIRVRNPQNRNLFDIATWRHLHQASLDFHGHKQ
jgi:hypothetical protein